MDNTVGTVDDFVAVMTNVIDHSCLKVTRQTKRRCLTRLASRHQELVANVARWPVKTVKEVTVGAD